MRFCTNCGKELTEESAFCDVCGTAVVDTTPVPAEQTKEEKEFLNLTHRLLRWEQKAWKIPGTVLLILGIVFSAIFLLMTLVGLATGTDDGAVVAGIGIVYMLIYGGLFLSLGIVQLVAAKKIQKYLDTLYTDFRTTYNRCDSVGMLVFCIFFSNIAFVFFLINFIRMKNNKELIERILN